MSKVQWYENLARQLKVLLSDERDFLANTANTAALLYGTLPDVNWVGFYLLRGDTPDEELVVGPFQGKPACVHLALGAGVCGAAAATLTTQRIADVHQFEGHIVCDADSRSELVVPLLQSGALIGVLDIDSPNVARFSESDQKGVESLCATFCELQARRATFI